MADESLILAGGVPGSRHSSARPVAVGQAPVALGADEALLLALACGATVENAARTAGVSVSTVYNRLAEPEFKKRLQGIRSDMVQRAAGALTASAQQAVQTLLALQKEGVQDGVRLGAARAVLNMGMKVREMAELEQQIEELRSKLESIEEANKCQSNARW